MSPPLRPKRELVVVLGLREEDRKDAHGRAIDLASKGPGVRPRAGTGRGADGCAPDTDASERFAQATPTRFGIVFEPQPAG